MNRFHRSHPNRRTGTAPVRYRFSSTWVLPVPASRAYEVLRDLRAYPAWWPEVREVVQVEQDRARVVCRSVLPYDLTFDLIRTIEDRATLTLETRLEGDLEGTTRWRITEEDGRSVCRFDEDVVTTKRLLNVLAPVGRWAFRLNHRLMMRNGLRGLSRHLRRSR